MKPIPTKYGWVCPNCNEIINFRLVRDSYRTYQHAPSRCIRCDEVLNWTNYQSRRGKNASTSYFI